MPVDALTPAAGRQVTQASGVLRTIGPPCCPRGAGELDGVEQLHAVHASRVNTEIRREPQLLRRRFSPLFEWWYFFH